MELGLVLGNLKKGLRKQGFARDWMLLGSRGNFMTGYLNKSNQMGAEWGDAKAVVDKEAAVTYMSQDGAVCSFLWLGQCLHFCQCPDVYGVILFLCWPITDSHRVALADVGALAMEMPGRFLETSRPSWQSHASFRMSSCFFLSRQCPEVEELVQTHAAQELRSRNVNTALPGL